MRVSRLTAQPPASAVTKAANGRMTAKGMPSTEAVATIESTPVWGVAIRNEATAPFEAPSRRSDMAVGITPQEQSGSGTPNRAASITDRKSGLDR